MLQLPIWSIYRFAKSPLPVSKAIVDIFHSTPLWGPRRQTDRNEWLKYHEEVKQRSRNMARASGHSRLVRAYNFAFGRY